jgi:hypothetical protein
MGIFKGGQGLFDWLKGGPSLKAEPTLPEDERAYLDPPSGGLGGEAPGG